MSKLLMMVVECPLWKEAKVSGPYPADQIKAWVHRTRMEHQLTDIVRHLRAPTPEELKLPESGTIFDMNSLTTEEEDFS